MSEGTDDPRYDDYRQGHGGDEPQPAVTEGGSTGVPAGREATGAEPDRKAGLEPLSVTAGVAADQRCDYCGFLDWTTEQYGRVAHKHACPHRTDPWCQTHPDGCPGVAADNATTIREAIAHLAWLGECEEDLTIRDMCEDASAALAVLEQTAAERDGYKARYDSYEPGTMEGQVRACWDLAEHYGHPAVSSKHPVGFLASYIKAAEARAAAAEDALREAYDAVIWMSGLGDLTGNDHWQKIRDEEMPGWRAALADAAAPAKEQA